MHPMNLAVLALCASSAVSSPNAPPARTEPAEVVLAVGFDQSHSAWNAILTANVVNGLFRYKSFVKDAGPLNAYLKELESVDQAEFAQFSRNDQKAFWINAYNAYTVKRVLQSYPFGKVNELGEAKKGPWDERTIPLGRLFPELKVEKLTLNEIENKILRPVFKDARVHAALNCAAVSCPALRGEAFVGERLDSQLATQAAKWIGNPTYNQFDAATKELRISQLFEWYAKDFADEAGSVEAWIVKNCKADVKWITGEGVKKSYLEYSWALNDAKDQ